MIRLTDVDLKDYTTFRVSAIANEFVIIENENELFQVFEQLGDTWMVLGRGSNVLFVGDYDGTIIHFKTNAYQIEKENENKIFVRVDAGFDWDEWVLTSLQHGLYGLENLSLIPGTVGAAPVQNIGAYGVEVSSRIHSIRIFDTTSRVFRELDKDNLCFSYRQSIFQQHPEWIITQVVFELDKFFQPELNYPSLKSFLENKSVLNPDPLEVRNAVIEIRTSKLPEPELLGNAGSFFKNPVIGLNEYERLKKEFPDIPGFVNDAQQQAKIPAAWLIEKAGLKGFRMGYAGVHELQPLVLINWGGATGEEIISLAKFIQEKVFQMFQIQLEPEVKIITP